MNVRVSTNPTSSNVTGKYVRKRLSDGSTKPFKYAPSFRKAIDLVFNSDSEKLQFELKCDHLKQHFRVSSLKEVVVKLIMEYELGLQSQNIPSTNLRNVLQQPTEALPHVIETVPNVIETVPCMIETVPHVIETVPCVIETVPDMIETVPHVIETVPHVIEALPHMIETVPHVIETVPRVIEIVPDMIETVPDFNDTDGNSEPDQKINFVAQCNNIVSLLNNVRNHENCSLALYVPYKLVYFPVRGRGQAIRYICKDNGLELEEEVVTGETWPKLKPDTPFGQLPVFYDGAIVLAQSNAIIRYLARKHGLYGKNDVEAAQIDMLNDQQEDLRLSYVRLIYQQYDTHKDEFIKNLPTSLAIFEKNLGKNHDGTGFFVGTQISFADYNIFDLLDNLQVLSPESLRDFPLLKAFHARIANHEKLLRYRQSDAFKNLPINGNGKQ